MPSLDIDIGGRNYKIACEEGQENHLEYLARGIDDHVKALKAKFGEIGDTRLTIMAALLVSDQLHELRGRLAQLEADLSTLRTRADNDLSAARRREEGAIEAVTMAAERVERLAASLGVHTG